MKLTSKIKEFLGEELMELAGSICDLRKIASNQDKMRLVVRLLTTYGINYSILGGATNRLAVLINGYVFKFALDNQGVKDNLIEYAISSELQPFVTKSYETSGYILVAEYVTVMTLDKFKARKSDILKVLSLLGNSYLLGDVGYNRKNYTNWGIRDDGSVVILDYAYCHRATEQLFKCDKCGEGLLTYDSTYTTLICTNRTAGCNAQYSYNDRKAIQGEQIDIDTVNEAKERSIVIKKGEESQEVTESADGNELYGDDVIVVHNPVEYEMALARQDTSAFSDNYDRSAAIGKLINIARKGNWNNAQDEVNDLNGIVVVPAEHKRIILADDYNDGSIVMESDRMNPPLEFLRGPAYRWSPFNMGIVEYTGPTEEDDEMYRQDIDQPEGLSLMVDVATSNEDIEMGQDTIVSLSNNYHHKKEANEMAGYYDPEVSYSDEWTTRLDNSIQEEDAGNFPFAELLQEQEIEQQEEESGASFSNLIQKAREARKRQLEVEQMVVPPAEEEPPAPEVVVDGVVHQ